MTTNTLVGTPDPQPLPRRLRRDRDGLATPHEGARRKPRWSAHAHGINPHNVWTAYYARQGARRAYLVGEAS